MLRKIGFSLLSAGMFFCTNSIAMNHELTPSMSIEYNLESNAPELFTNFTIFTINAKCTILTDDEDDVIHVRVVRRSGEINGKPVNTGEEMDIVVRNGDTMTISAKSNAQVELTNKGQSTLKAACKTV